MCFETKWNRERKLTRNQKSEILMYNKTEHKYLIFNADTLTDPIQSFNMTAETLENFNIFN